ncbi:MAG TPA: hypothetical protein VEC57_14760 [Candidatus Limnocylindrales bacterium]|nr:hypothetical protein [Candidatus Limnocylindrales bacterium]
MIRFDLPPGTRAKLTKVTPRKEQHGPDLKQAVSLRLRLEGPGELLDMLAPGLRDASLRVPPRDDTQEMIEGVPQIPTMLRVQGVDQVRKLPELKLTGYTLTIDHGIDESSALELYTCHIDKVTAEAKQGGGSVIEWSVGSNREITKELVGELCDLEGTEIEFSQVGPVPGEVIDGTTEAFERDHPLFDQVGEDDDGPGDGDDTGHGFDQDADSESAVAEDDTPPVTRGRRGRKAKTADATDEWVERNRAAAAGAH